MRFLADPTQRIAHLYDRRSKILVSENITAEEYGGLEARPDDDDVILICPHCHKKGEIHRLLFRSKTEQTIHVERRNRITQQKEMQPRRYYLPPRFAGWPNSGDHACYLKNVLGRHYRFGTHHGDMVNAENSNVFRYINYAPGAPDNDVLVSKGQSLRHASVQAFDDTAQPKRSPRKPPQSKGLRRVQDYHALYEIIKDDPELLAHQQFIDPPYTLLGNEIFLLDPMRQFQILFNDSQKGKRHVSIADFRPLPQNIWKDYASGVRWSIPGRSVRIHHGDAEIYGAMLLTFENESLYRQALAYFAQQSREGQKKYLRVAGYGYINPEEFTAKIEGVHTRDEAQPLLQTNGQISMNFGRVSKKEDRAKGDHRTIWMRYHIVSPDQFMPLAIAKDQKPEKKKNKSLKGPVAEAAELLL